MKYRFFSMVHFFSVFLIAFALLPAVHGEEAPHIAKIVSISPVLTEIAWELGAGELLVGRSQWCDWPPEVLQLPIVGGFSGASVSIETIRAIDPDIVLLSPFMHIRLIPLFKRAGIAFFGADSNSFEEIIEDTRRLGRAIGRDEEGMNLAARMLNDLAALDAALASALPPGVDTSGRNGKGGKGVFYLLQEDPLMSCGRGSFIDELIERAGGHNIFTEVQEAWPLVSIEALRLADPDFILMDSQNYARLFGRGSSYRGPLNKLRAVKAGNIIAIDGDLLSRPGPRLIQAAWILARALGTVE